MQVPIAFFLKQLSKSDGHVDIAGGIWASGFEQQDVNDGIFGQAIGQNTTGRTRPDNDVVVSFHRGLHVRQTWSRASIRIRLA